MTGVHAATRGCNERGQDMMAVMQGVCFTYRTPTSLAGKAVPQQHGGLRLLHKAQQPLRRNSDMCSDDCNGWAVGTHSRLHTRVCMHLMHALSEPALHLCRFRRPTFWQWDGWWVESLQTRRDLAGRFETGFRSLGKSQNASGAITACTDVQSAAVTCAAQRRLRDTVTAPETHLQLATQLNSFSALLHSLCGSCGMARTV